MKHRAPGSARWLLLQGIFVVVLACGVAGQTPQAPPATQTPEAPGTEKLQMLPGQYLETIGQHVKARWRQQYREAPASFSSERLRVAFMLGGLMAESHLAVQAGDAQRFRNNNQEVQKLCAVLGLTDKISPDVRMGSKMAESEDWPALRSQVQLTEQHIESVLNEQRDEDLAILLGLGTWIRLFDIGSSLVVEEPELANKGICIGSIGLLDSLVARFDQLTELSRTNEAVALVGGVLEMLQRHWSAAEDMPTQEVVQMTHDKVRFVIGKVEAK